MKTTKYDLEQFIYHHIVDEYNVHPATVSKDAKLQDELGIDSLDKVEISCDIEKKFSVTLDDEAIDNATTFGELVDAAFSSFQNTEDEN
ncbi:MAG: hypothetical protein JJE55_08105 [Flavobacteriaceae bacterium]|nr:hypothetical protein [Flavobacteriaceae bacterium]